MTAGLHLQGPLCSAPVFPLIALVLLASAAVAVSATDALPDILSAEWSLHQKTKEEGVRRLQEQARAQLEVVQKGQMQQGKLEAANAIHLAMTSLPEVPSPGQAVPEDLPPAAAAVFTQYLTKVSAGTVALNQQTIARLEKAKIELLKGGNLPGANAAEAAIKQLREELDLLSPAPPAPDAGKKAESFVVEALVDGNSELHVTAAGIYWVVPGSSSKPGLHEGADEPTYVDDRRWKPKWQEKGERGPDTSDVYPLPTNAPTLFAETLKVSKERHGKSEPRTAVSTRLKDGRFVVTIPDPEGGSRWYKIRIKSVP